MHRYRLFATIYAPHISAAEAADDLRAVRYANVIPIAHDGEHLVMVRLDGGSFASKIAEGETTRDAARRLRPFLSCAEEQQDHNSPSGAP
jgi:hypothetical protein